MSTLYSSIFSLGSGLCHQIPDRSFIFQGIQLPLCARCSGIYLGCVIALIVLFVSYRGAQRRGGISAFYYGALVVFALPMVIDGFTSYLGIRSTTNFIRLWSGAGFGAMLAVPLYYMMCDALLKRARRETVLKDARTRILFVLSIPLNFVLVRFLGEVAPMVVVALEGASIVIVFSCVASALVGLVVPRFERSIDSVKSAIIPAILSLALGALILFGTWELQTFIHRLAGV